MADEPIIPDLADVPEPPAGDLADLPVSEPLQAPVPAEERVTQPQAPPTPNEAFVASQNGSSVHSEILHELNERQIAAAAAHGRPTFAETPGRATREPGSWQMFGAIQSDLEQLHAEATSTRRATQLLALSIAAAAALVIFYAVRAARSPAPVSK